MHKRCLNYIGSIICHCLPTIMVINLKCIPIIFKIGNYIYWYHWTREYKTPHFPKIVSGGQHLINWNL